MSSESQNLFDAVARIERAADDIIAQAKLAARRIHQNAEKEAAEIAAATNARIEAAAEQMAKEHDAATRSELQKTQQQFEQEKQNIDRIRDEKMEVLASWTAEEIRRHCLKK